MSLNAAIFASVCLGSRLPTYWHVYVYVMLAIQLFALFPEFQRDVKVRFFSDYEGNEVRLCKIQQ